MENPLELVVKFFQGWRHALIHRPAARRIWLTTIAPMVYYARVTLDEAILEYLFDEGKARQIKQITIDINEKKDLFTSDGYVGTVLRKLKKQGLVKVSTHRGWWSLTEKGEARAAGIEFKEPFFSREEVNSSEYLRVITQPKDKANALAMADYIGLEFLELFVGLYSIKMDYPIPVGREVTDVDTIMRINNKFKSLAEAVMECRRENNGG